MADADEEEKGRAPKKAASKRVTKKKAPDAGPPALPPPPRSKWNITVDQVEPYRVIFELAIKAVAFAVCALVYLVGAGFLFWKPNEYLVIFECVGTGGWAYILRHYFPGGKPPSSRGRKS